MPPSVIDAWLADIAEPRRSALEALRRTIRTVVPDAVECLSYGMPCFKVRGKAVAGFAAFKQRNSYFPFSGATLATLATELTAYSKTKSALHFPVDGGLPADLVRQLIQARLAEIRPGTKQA